MEKVKRSDPNKIHYFHVRIKRHVADSRYLLFRLRDVEEKNTFTQDVFRVNKAFSETKMYI